MSSTSRFAVSGITTPASVGASSSTTFTVTFDPTSAGAQSATITIASDDPDTPSYTFAVQGAGTTAPSFSQQFAPNAILQNGTSTLTFTIDNSANASSATSLAFTNNLPAGLTVASPSNASTTCTGGTLTASGGSSAISLSGASVSAAASCTVNVDVTAASDGSFVNTTGDLTSSLGNSGSENNVSVDSITAPGSGSLAASATTTFTVLYTPTIAGAFSFEIDIVSDDADEANYDITVSGTATGATNGESLSGETESGAEWRSGWDFWAKGTYAVTDNNSSDSQTGLFFAGVDYRYKDKAVVGVMGQLDITDETNGSENTSADGVGWMAGPYAVLRLHQNFYLDGVATYGQCYNSVNALGLFEDDFRTQRFLLQGGMTGDFKIDQHTKVSPFARITYYFEEQESYTDTLGRLIPSQDFDLGRIEFGPKVSWDLILDDRLLFSPFLSLTGIYDFNKLQDDTPSDAILASSNEDLRARLEAGAGLLVPSRNIRISGEGFYDGIGAADFQSYGVSLSVSIPF